MPPVAITTFAPRRVIALAELFVELTTAPDSIESTPPLPTPFPSESVSAAKEMVPLPALIVAPAATVRLPWAVTSTFPPPAVVTLPSVRSPNPARYTPEGCNVSPTTTLAGVFVASN